MDSGNMVAVALATGVRGPAYVMMSQVLVVLIPTLGGPNSKGKALSSPQFISLLAASFSVCLFVCFCFPNSNKMVFELIKTKRSHGGGG